jgi:DNA (cytosine-5)-methyltransferase 1
MRFVDLFAGLGGFHLALRRLGHTCVFACEIDDTLREVYERNFGLKPEGDIAAISADDIPAHDILCAGFPCQPFSKAGDQKGLDDLEVGGLYREIIRIIRRHQPRYLILENVPNLQMHDAGKTWDRISGLLRKEGYAVAAAKLSPHRFGIPQIRERIYIVGSRRPLDGFSWPEELTRDPGALSIHSILDTDPPDALKIPDQVKRCLQVWQGFLDHMPSDEKVPHPLWSMEFGATYPFELTTPSRLTRAALARYRGSHGIQLGGAATRTEMLRRIPSHGRRPQARFPDWKIDFIRKNRLFYSEHKRWLDRWVTQIVEFPSSFQKLEWNCQENDPRDEVRDLTKYVIQIRPSGVRVKRPNTAPSLVAMTATQIPIIAWEGRYMTLQECKRLQSMEELQHLPETPTAAYAALGNAICVDVAVRVAEGLVGRAAHGRAAGTAPLDVGVEKRVHLVHGGVREGA